MSVPSFGKGVPNFGPVVPNFGMGVPKLGRAWRPCRAQASARTGGPSKVARSR
jgi:hypothetical protein